MATVVNFIDVTLRGAAARTVNLASAQILLTPSAPAFHVDVDGVVTPEAITFTATRIDIDAPLTFNCTGGSLTNATATTVTLAGADMVGSSATVIASATVNGQTYTGPCTVSKFKDGKDGLNGDGADLTPGDLKAILEGQLTTDELDAALRGRIGLIDGGADVAGSVTARVKAETDARIAAISQQATDNRTYVQQYTYSQQTINDSFSAFGTSIQAAYQGYANGAADGALAAAKSFAQSYSYSKADADSSLTATANQLRSEFATLNQGAGATVAWVQEYAYSKAQANDAIASATQQLSTTVAGHTSTLEIQGQSISGLGAQYTVKIDNNGWAAGYGLASTPINGVPTSSFIVLADRFAVALPGQTPKFPFVIGTVNGQTVIGLRGDVVLDGTLNIRTAAGYKGDMDATKGATWGANISGQPEDISNLVKKGTFEDGLKGRWDAAQGVEAKSAEPGSNPDAVPFAKCLVTHARDVVAWDNRIDVTAGEALFFGAWLNTWASSYSGAFGAQVYAADGALIGWVAVVGRGPRSGWLYQEASWPIPATMMSADGVTRVPAYVLPWLQLNGFDFSAGNYLRATGLWIGRHERGATAGAPAGSKVGNTEAQLVADRAYNGQRSWENIPAINNELGRRLNAEASNILRAPIAITTGGGVVVGSLTYDANSGQRGGGQGVAITPVGLIGHNGTKYTFVIDAATGKATFCDELQAAYGTFGALRIASGGYIATGNYNGGWRWPGAGQGGGFQITERGILAGNADDPGRGFFQVEFDTGLVAMPGLTYSGRQMRLDSPIIINPVLSPFNVGITNSQNQYSYSLYRQSTDAYAGLYTVAVSTGNDGASFNWTVQGPWPCWLVQDTNSTRMQLHINMKGGAALAGDSGDFYINCSATKGGNTVNTSTLVEVTAS